MMDWNEGIGWGGWLIGCVMMLAFLALVVLVVLFANGSRSGSRLGRPTARDILDEQLACGEIDVEEYTSKRDMLGRGEDVPRVG